MDSKEGDSHDRNQEESSPHHTHNTSPSELLSSAQFLAGAVQSTLKHEHVDKSKAADAADDLLNAASQYGKLEERGYGSYVEKGETYLHQYTSGNPPPPTTATAPPSEKNDDSAGAEESEGGLGGLGGVMKMAQGFFK